MTAGAAILLVVDAAAFDEPAVRSAASALGWTVALETLDGAPLASVPTARPGRFSDIVRVRLSEGSGEAVPDAGPLLRALGHPPWLVSDETRRLDG